MNNVNLLRELDGRSKRHMVPERKSKQLRKLFFRRVAKNSFDRSSKPPSKEFQQASGLALPTKLAHNRNMTTMNRVQVYASLIEEHNNAKNDLEAERRKSSVI